jgi:hypothetical protein
MKLILGRISSAFIALAWAALLGARLVLDLIGYSTAPEDVHVAQTRLDQFIGWLLSVPWWVSIGHSPCGHSLADVGFMATPRSYAVPEGPRPCCSGRKQGERRCCSYGVPTAADLLEEQEGREAFYAMEQLYQRANHVRAQLETVVVQAAVQIERDNQPLSRAFRFFVKQTVFSQYRQACKKVVQKGDDAVRDKSLAHLIPGVAA